MKYLSSPSEGSGGAFFPSKGRERERGPVGGLSAAFDLLLNGKYPGKTERVTFSLKEGTLSFK